MTFDEKRKQIGVWLKEPDGGKLWDLMCSLRGPDHPSERPDMETDQHSRAYAARRARKYKTVEIVRQRAFFGVVGGSARYHSDDHILLPHPDQRDHFDRHMERAASILGLKIEIDQRKKSVEVVFVKPE